jgi:hypothetical protein
VDDASLLAAFADTSLPTEAFHHREHVRVAWMYVMRYGVAGALTQFGAALKRFAVAKGKPQLYHETITWSYLLLIGERVARRPAATSEAFVARESDLLAWKPSVLDRYYTTELLWSDIARTTFVMPDRVRTADDADYLGACPSNRS